MIAFCLFIMWLLLPVVGWIVYVCRGRKMHPALFVFLIGIFGCMLLITAVWVGGMEGQADLDRYDLDGNGSFSEEELTPEAAAALDDWANDAGSVMGSALAIPMTGIWYGFAFATMFAGGLLVTSIFRESAICSGSLTLPKKQHSAKARPDDGNPFQSPPPSQ